MFIKAGDLDVHVQVSGPPGAPALVMLHSLGTSLHLWDPTAEALSGAFRVIRPDLRGHGLTTVTPGPYTIEGLARDVLAVMDALEVGTAHVAGMSLGGMVAQSLAAQAPGRVMSLILADTALAIPTVESWRERAATVRANGTAALQDAVLARWVTPAVIASPAAQGLRAMMLRTAAEGYAAAAEAIAVADLTAGTRALRLPALVLVGDQDEATPPASAEALRDAIPGATLEILPGAAHLPVAEVPDLVTDAIRRFLASAPADIHAAGMAVRRQVLGEAHVERATAATTDFDRAFQEFITRTAWGGVWTRPGLDRRTRSLLTIALMAALGHEEELKLHVRASRNTGATPADIAEALIQVAAYAGIPAANAAVRAAKETLTDMGAG